MEEHNTSGDADTTSLWFGTFVPPTFPSLGGSARTEVCVIGGGIAGLSTAYLLTKAGKKVTVLDAGPLGAGESGRTAAHLASAMDDRIDALERMHGADDARRIVQSHRAAIDRIETIVQAETIDCDFRRVDGYLVLDGGGSERILDEEMAAATRAGLTDVVKLASVPGAEFDFGPALRFPNQGQFHALEYLAGLTSAIVLSGGRIYSDTRVASVTPGTPCTVTTDDGLTITADAICVCTNAPLTDTPDSRVEQALSRTFAIAATVPRDSIEPALYWDTADPYHYVRLHPMADPASSLETRSKKPAKDGATKGARKSAKNDAKSSVQFDTLIVGGEDDAAGALGSSGAVSASDANDRWQRLETWMRERWPQAGQVVHKWSGRVFEPADHVAFIGRSPHGAENVYIATGDSGHGMTYGMIAGTLLSDLICGRANDLESLYDPRRAARRGP